MQKINDFSDFTHLFWDLDGTLTESGPGIINCVRYALESLGIKEPNDENIKRFIGPPLVYSFKTFYGFDDEKTKLAIKKYRERYAQSGILENSVYEGVAQTLEALKTKGKKLYIATSKPEIYMFKIIKNFDLEKYFDFACGSDLQETRNDKTKVINHLLQHENLDAIRDEGKILMIGDRKHDIIGARENGIKTCAVLWGYGSKQEFEQNGADYIIASPSELI